MKSTLETIIKQTRSALLEEARLQAQMHRSDVAKHLRSVADRAPEEMLRSVADMVTTGDDLSGLAEREALVDDGRPVDATGEPLEVGDLVRFGSVVASIKEFRRRAGGFQAYLPGKKRFPWFHVALLTKITTLTREEYLPLARRTMDPDLTRKERLAMLAMGVIGEVNEFIWCRKPDEIVAEAGDVLWYAEQLMDEIGELQGDGYIVPDWGDVALWELVKKAVFHGVEVDKLRQIAAMAIVHVQELLDEMGVDMGEARAANIKKLMRRYPGGFVSGGGVR